MNKLSAGQVFRYPYLWRYQQQGNEETGRKLRPCVLAVSTVNEKRETIVFLVPITTKFPNKAISAIEVPEIEKRRAGLDLEFRHWVILNELNVDILETSYYFEDREPMGEFSKSFLNMIVDTLVENVSRSKDIVLRR